MTLDHKLIWFNFWVVYKVAQSNKVVDVLSRYKEHEAVLIEISSLEILGQLLDKIKKGEMDVAWTKKSLICFTKIRSICYLSCAYLCIVQIFIAVHVKTWSAHGNRFDMMLLERKAGYCKRLCGGLLGLPTK